ncbi:MAG: TnsA endonuclease N-terminal domain-containing protein [bacterium]
MSLKFAQGTYKLKFPDKYIGTGSPRYRSSWELAVMKMCDENVGIQQWASESIKIPYRDPLTGKHTVYVPDFLVVYTDKNQHKHAEVWEIKPRSQTMLESVGKNKYNQAHYIKNMAKWQVARQWCAKHGLQFRVLNEDDIFHVGGKRR